MPETDLEKLKRLSAWEAEPALSEDDLEAILGGAALADQVEGTGDAAGVVVGPFRHMMIVQSK